MSGISASWPLSDDEFEPFSSELILGETKSDTRWDETSGWLLMIVFEGNDREGMAKFSCEQQVQGFLPSLFSSSARLGEDLEDEDGKKPFLRPIIGREPAGA